nr:MAG TPA: hypothetical protein [Caudoviricetes sp.]
MIGILKHPDVFIHILWHYYNPVTFVVSEKYI